MAKIKNAMVASVGLMFALAVTGCTATGDSGVDGDPVTNVDATEPVEVTETAAPSESAEPEEPSSTTGPAESEGADEFEPSAVNGRWCAAPDSPTDDGCITIELPNVAFDSGAPTLTISVVDEDADGCVVLSQGDAPFGTYCGAGIELSLPDENFAGSDYPDEDRIWNSQTGWMYLRE